MTKSLGVDLRRRIVGGVTGGASCRAAAASRGKRAPPLGGAADNIKRQWRGKSLPARLDSPTGGPVSGPLRNKVWDRHWSGFHGITAKPLISLASRTGFEPVLPP